MSETKDFSEILNHILDGIKRNLECKTIRVSDYIKIYNFIYQYCNKLEYPNTIKTVVENEFYNEDIYCQIFIKEFKKILVEYFDFNKILKYSDVSISNYIIQWEKFQRNSKNCENILNYFINHFVRDETVKEKNKFVDFNTLATKIWNKKVFKVYKAFLYEEAILILDNYINGESVDIFTLKKFINHISNLRYKYTNNLHNISNYPSLFETDFNPRFLETISKFLISFNEINSCTTDIIEYLKLLVNLKDSEIFRTLYCINGFKFKEINKLIYDYCIFPQLKRFEALFNEYLINESNDKILFLIINLKNINSDEILKTCISENLPTALLNKFKSLAIDKNNPIQLMMGLYDAVKIYETILSPIAFSSPEFVDIYNNSIRYLLNNIFDKDESNTIHYSLVLYINIILTTHTDFASKFLLTDVGVKFIIFCSLVEDKEFLIKYYTGFFLNRFFNMISSVENMEISLIANLLRWIEPRYCRSLQNILRDYTLSLMHNQTFYSNIQELQSNIIPKFYCLLKNFWDVNDIIKFSVPPELDSVYDKFKEFYKKEFPLKNILFAENLTIAVLEISFPQGIFKITINGMYATIILLFRFSEALTFGEIYESTKAHINMLKLMLINLIEMGLFITNNRLESINDISEDTIFMFNINFYRDNILNTSSRTVLQYRISSINENNEENLRCKDDIIQACIMQLLKKEFELESSDFKNKVSEILKSFNLKENDIDINIEFLQIRNYLRFNEKNNSFVYIE